MSQVICHTHKNDNAPKFAIRKGAQVLDTFHGTLTDVGQIAENFARNEGGTVIVYLLGRRCPVEVARYSLVDYP